METGSFCPLALPQTSTLRHLISLLNMSHPPTPALKLQNAGLLQGNLVQQRFLQFHGFAGKGCSQSSRSPGNSELNTEVFFATVLLTVSNTSVVPRESPRMGGPQGAQPVKHSTLDFGSGRDLTVVKSRPSLAAALGVELA